MRHEVIDIPDGWGGTQATVQTAYRLVNASLRDPVVVTTAQNIVRHLPERDKLAEVQAVSGYVKRNVRYTNEGIETLKTPRLMLDEIRRYGKAVGDCDDHVILWAALHKAVGNPVRFRVISQRQDGLANHIYGEVYVPRHGWISDELIVKHRPLGWHIPQREVTKSVAFMGGLGGHMAQDVFTLGAADVFTLGARRRWGPPSHAPAWGRRQRTAPGLFTPGGARTLHQQRLMPYRERFAVEPFVTQGYAIKHGGALVDGGALGILPVAALAPVAVKYAPKLLARFGKKKRRKGEPAAVPICPPGYKPVLQGVDDYLQLGQQYQ